MTISVTVKPSSSKGPLVERTDEDLAVYLRAKAVDGAANNQLIEVLARHFNVSKTKVVIKRDVTSHHKIIKILQFGGRLTKIYVDNILYDGNRLEKLREIAKAAQIDYSKWDEYKRTGTVHFAIELMKRLPS